MARGDTATQMKKGFIRLFILKNLYSGPLHGYGIIKKITERSGGFWSPQPGNIYPLIRIMAKEGLVIRCSSDSRRKEYKITEKGKRELLELMEDAENSTIHLVEAMSKNEDEWIETHIQILKEISPEDIDERVLTQRRNIEKLLKILSSTLSKIKKLQASNLGKTVNNEENGKGGK